MKYRVTVPIRGQDDIVEEMTAKTELAVKIRINKRIEKENIPEALVGDFKIEELGEEDD